MGKSPMFRFGIAMGLTLWAACGGRATEPWAPLRCELLPLANHQVSLMIDGRQRVDWHFGSQYPRPFFFPLSGPDGISLTRMGHPGAENHGHHRSVWFAFHDVDGVDFWSDKQGTQIRQKHWYRYRDGDSEAVMATKLGWYDAENRERMEQDLVAALIPISDEQYALELQIDLRPPTHSDTVQLGKTNFGFLAVRVAASLSVHFGGGKLTNSEGAIGEPAIFAQPARWVDYSGPVAVGTGESRKTKVAGITYFDHPDNPRYPTHWHVREDGWMGAAFCLQEGFTLTRETGLRLRYLLLVHEGAYDPELAAGIHESFAKRPAFEIRKARPDERHRQYEVERVASGRGDDAQRNGSAASGSVGEFREPLPQSP